MAWFYRVAVIALLVSATAAAQGRLPLNRGPKIHAQIERLSKMPPAQRERALSKLPPQRKAIVQDRLDRYNELSPKQREKLRNEYESFQQLPPERQEQLRRSFRQLNELPEDRRKPVRQEIVRLRGLSPDERKTRIESDRFKSKFSEEERHLLGNLAEFIPSPEPESDGK